MLAPIEPPGDPLHENEIKIMIQKYISFVHSRDIHTYMTRSSTYIQVIYRDIYMRMDPATYTQHQQQQRSSR